MARQKSGRPRGRPRTTLLSNSPTTAEQVALDAIASLTALGDAPTPLDIANACGWTRQRASAVIKRLDSKGLLAKDAIRGRRGGAKDAAEAEG